MSIIGVITHPRVRQWLPGVLNGGILLLLTASLAQWTWLLAKPSLPSLIVTPSHTPASKSFSIQPLLAAHLFGQVSQELTGGRLDTLPLSSLNLVLTGLIASDNGGYALISVNAGPQESYAVGQTITSGAVLQAVYPDRVVIQHNNALETLILEGMEKPQPEQSAALSTAYRPPVASGPIVQQTGANHYMVVRDQLAAQMRTPEFFQQARVIPFAGGGFVMSQIQPGSLYEKLGLRAGDVIKTFNGQPLNSAEDAMRLYQQMSSFSSVQMEIMRGGRSEFLYYQLSQN